MTTERPVPAAAVRIADAALRSHRDRRGYETDAWAACTALASAGWLHDPAGTAAAKALLATILEIVNRYEGTDPARAMDEIHNACMASIDATPTSAGVLVAEDSPGLRDPRVWFDGDEVPSGVWVYKADGDCVEPEDRIEMLDPYEPIINGNHGPLVEIVLPDIDAIVERAEERR